MNEMSFKLKKSILDIDNNIGKVINILNKHSSRIVIITKKGKFFGIINDGDLRRGFLKGYTIKDKIVKIVNTKSITVKPKTQKKTIIELMKKINVFKFLK